MEKLLFVGIDVDDKHYHASVYDHASSDSFEFKSAPTVSHLIKAFGKHNLAADRLRICYEATYIGFSLLRRLNDAGFHCQITAPSLIPTQPGARQKTDRFDSKKLAQFYAKGLLTFIYIPDETDEAVRDLLRSHQFLMRQLTMVKNHINSLCRRMGRDYLQESGKKSRWTQHHLEWLSKTANDAKQSAAKINLRILMKQYEDLAQNIELYETEIEHLAAEPKYEKKTKVLTAFKGVKTTTALTLITELGDIRRFDHPRRITSYAGFDLAEYSSGGKAKRFGITKFGNSNIRRAAVSAIKFTIRSPAAGKDLTIRRRNIDVEIAKIAAKCSARLYKKGSRMLHSGKPKKKVQVACAREFLGFVWEALQKAS